MDRESELVDIEIVADNTAIGRLDEGFLRLRRLRVRNRFADGSTSPDYSCDIVTRPSADAVAIALYAIDRTAEKRRVVVVLKQGSRVPVYLRKDAELVIADDRRYLKIVELVAGLIEAGDDGERGLERRASLESAEEAGYDVPLDRIEMLGGGTFASPGISDEKVYYCSADVSGLEASTPSGDGSVMEQGTEAIVLDLREAIRRCRSGAIPDMKTEVGLLRLADQLGYVAQLDRFVDELPSGVRERFDSLGAGSA